MPIHTAVAGRARLYVSRLRGNEALRAALEGAAPDPQIHRIRCSTLTGNLLVEFDRHLSVAEVAARILRLSSGEAHGAASPPRAAAPPWHHLSAGKVLRELGSSREGLSEVAAARRREEHGDNTLPAAPSPSPIGMLLEQFRSLPIVLLVGAAVLSVATGGVADALAILAVVGLNAAIGFATESRTNRIIGSLSLPFQPSVPVYREGIARAVATAAIVPGDVMVLRPGVIVAADGRMLSADALSIDESMLTGESLPVEKDPAPVARDCPLAERTSMVYRGSAVVGGSGLAVAVATGRHSEAGKIQALVGATDPPKTPMQQQLDTLGRQLVLLSGAVCGVVFLLGLMRGQRFLAMLKSSIALAVAAIPEGLPTVGTAALALGIDKMRRQQVLVRRLRAVETLATVDVIAFDKTGTLTENRMSVAAIACGGERLAVLEGQHGNPAPGKAGALARLLQVAILCNEATVETVLDRERIAGSPTETALLRFARDLGLDPAALRRSFPTEAMGYRSAGRLYMVSLHHGEKGTWLLASKGSPEAVLARCAWQQRGGRRRRLTLKSRAAILAENQKMARAGLRVLGLAYAERGKNGATAQSMEGQDFVWLGIVGLADPARQGAAAVLSRVRRAGIRTIILTGDQAPTASALARGLGLGADVPMETRDIHALRMPGEQTLDEIVRDAGVFARATPEDKLRIVQALQRSGRIVAVAGDGINDSPALRAANIGIVMGRSGTDAAREIADMVLASDDLAALTEALALGRTTYANIRKSIHFLLATNLSEILVMLVATALGFGSILSPMQLLWINLVSDVLPALGLALEPAESGVLEQAPRRADEPILGVEEMIALGCEGTTIAAGTILAYALAMARHGDAARASTLSFSSLVGAQLLHALTSRSPHAGPFSGEALPPNRALAAALIGSASLQLALLLVPRLRRLMGLAPLDLGDAVLGLLGAALPYAANEATKILSPAPA